MLELAPAEAAARIQSEMPLVAHAPALARRLGIAPFRGLDLLELFAFVRAARFCLPTPRGLAAAVGLPPPRSKAAEVEALIGAARVLLQEQAARSDDPHALPVAWGMARAGWPWGPALLNALGFSPENGNATEAPRVQRAMAVWERLQAWQEEAPLPPPSSHPVSSAETRHRLSDLLGTDAEPRPSQADYASAAAGAFQPRERRDEPLFVIAEAGTGVGKTLGYIAPASVWSEKNGAPVWISTYTRNLQHQVDRELERLFPDAEERQGKVVIRKGRENYLCLLNLEDATRVVGARPGDTVVLGLMVRWAERTRDGDMVGGDFPAWLPDLLGAARTRGLADQRGECIYAACPHYQKCFIERNVRRARRAELVVANHALVMAQAALGGLDDAYLPTRYVFDEGHHLFDAADSAFSAVLSGLETAELRRWMLGAEGGRSRARGLRRRMEDLSADEETADAVEQAVRAAAILPAEGWMLRLAEGRPQGPVETFLALVRQQVAARAVGPDAPYGIEADLLPAVDGLPEASASLAAALAKLARPLSALRRRLLQRLEDEADTLETAMRLRIEGLCRSLQRRAEVQVTAWRSMLDGMGAEPTAEFVDWLAIDRIEGRDFDVGMHRHWVDPTVPFAASIGGHAHGLLVTSATLRDATGNPEADWLAAEARTGAVHFSAPALRAAVPSPFDYVRQTRVLIVTDVRKDDLSQVAAAYRALFMASGGGGLGLFTAIGRLRAVHERIVEPLEAEGRMLLAQHVDRMDVNTLIEIFRAEPDSCLLGTDAVRDGVDVPGRALRLIVFDRVPWPRPDILHRARRARFGGRAYDDRITRLRLRQAFGRLVRRADDCGVFVLLDPMMPSRLCSAFPEGVAVQRVGLAEAVATTRAFIGAGGEPRADRVTGV
ncbi:ATP-dependent DNA helicase DinG [Constrictibacter sp. MBR-5]|jgi:ATP-dependent DNA helicase DinG|uniref:ATP-dependent DNA helicase n=1 Tax=Constrictibacter sp. MBR-5 TaxID=3156467 RepID=UPI00339A3195